MKNLKKSLALVLAIVMVFSLVVFANAEFADADQIAPKYKDACGVMNGLGILKGDQNGNFMPQGTLKRDQAAKIIAWLKLGKSAETLPANQVFDDVAADNWAAKYVAYCSSKNIINGDGTGKFNPNQELSGYAFGKMLLCAIGYGQKNEYVGDSWKINVAVDAANTGLFANLSDYLTDEALPREVAAQLAFNALDIPLVKTSENAYEPFTDGRTLATTIQDVNTEPTTTVDADGRPVKAYYKNSDFVWVDVTFPFDPLYPGYYELAPGAKPVYATTAEPVYTTTAGWDAAIAANKNFVVSGVDYYLNTDDSVSQSDIQLLGAGATIEFYGTPIADGKIKISTVVATAYTFDEVTAVAENKISLKGAGDITDAANIKLLKDFAKDDTLAIVWNGSKIVSVAKAEPLTAAKITAAAPGSATIDGTKYVVAKALGTLALGEVKGTYFTAPNGAIIGYKGVYTPPAAKVYVFYVASFKKTVSTEFGTADNYFAQVVTEEGEKVNYQTKINYADPDGNPSTPDAYDQGVYQLVIAPENGIDFATLQADTPLTIASENSEVKTGNKTTDNGVYYPASGVKFIQVKGTLAACKVTVLSSVPTFDTTGNKGDIFYHFTEDANHNKSAAVIFTTEDLKGAAPATTGYAYTAGEAADSTSAVLKTNAKGEEKTAYEKTVYVDGEKQTIYVENKAAMGEGFYKLAADGELTTYTLETSVATLIAKTQVTKNAAGYLSVSGHPDMTYAGATFVNLTTNPALTGADKLGTTNYVALVLGTTGNPTVIYAVG